MFSGFANIALCVCVWSLMDDNMPLDFCVTVLDTHPLLLTFQLMLLEHIIMCRLIMGHKSIAIQEVSSFIRPSL